MLDRQHVIGAVKPLRFIFWGGLLWIFDLSFTTTTNGTGFRCDILDDTVGTLLITVAIFRLAAAPVGPRYRAIMTFLKPVAIASVIATAMHHFVFEKPMLLGLAETVLGLCQLVGTVLFCRAMGLFCEAADLRRAAQSWRVTFWLFVVIYLLPLGLVYFISLMAMLTGNSFNINLGVGALLLLPVFAVPLIHLFVSTSRMRRDAEGDEPGTTPRGFEVITPEEGR